MALTEKGTLAFGVEVDGVVHKDFELRLATMADWEDALEAAGEGACQARVNRHAWAKTLVKLGALPREQITAELLGSLAATEYGLLAAAEASLRGKLAAANASSGSSGS
ncbi:hypothetical protein SAMN04488503_1995 [Humidesulfovibrio mexicanus]|uniref:Uncharacterized protein n=1 Tax=Humidesulfovibrio mexicanus TaxID=147047 RepID=A0A239AIT9_9BACT|nr:hypothetical protein [Humidesulfovibrio mexicanus]SNR95262.1 hypothetical protein SAMN04488503_1995 [Humidesulfovibrio mexicanus]